jgi:acetyltransferase-like isoleucine patch superfamily enzyme
LKKKIIGFDVANLFLQRVDKQSLLLILKKNGATIGEQCDIETGLTFHNCKNYSNLFVGTNCHIGKNCFFDLHEKVIIGNNVVISMQCTLLTHIDLNKSTLSTKYPAETGDIVVGDNSYLGANTTVLHKVSIGKNVVSAAGAVITKNVEDHCLVGGVPAIIIKTFN